MKDFADEFDFSDFLRLALDTLHLALCTLHFALCSDPEDPADLADQKDPTKTSFIKSNMCVCFILYKHLQTN